MFFIFLPQADPPSYVVIFKTHCHNTVTKDLVVGIVGQLVIL
jgi:hypothetical protein